MPTEIVMGDNYDPTKFETVPVAGAAAQPPPAVDQQRMDGRACGTGDTREITRWVVEWWQEEWKMWIAEQLRHTSREDGEYWMREAIETRIEPVPVRLVEVVERKTVLDVVGAGSPIDPKLSDCGARRGSCGVERTETAQATGEQRTEETAASVEIAATVTRGAVRCSAWLGVIELRSNPRIESVDGTRVEAKKGRDSMVSVHDLIALKLFDENCRCVEPSCPLYELPRSEKALPRLAFLEFCDGCKAAMNVAVDDPLDPLLRAWAEAGENTGDWVPLPSELTDRLDRMSVEILVPDGAECEVGGAMERPTVSLDERSKPDVEHGIGHGAENLSSNLNIHNP